MEFGESFSNVFNDAPPPTSAFVAIYLNVNIPGSSYCVLRCFHGENNYPLARRKAPQLLSLFNSSVHCAGRLDGFYVGAALSEVHYIPISGPVCYLIHILRLSPEERTGASRAICRRKEQMFVWQRDTKHKQRRLEKQEDGLGISSRRCARGRCTGNGMSHFGQ
ncbi:hypothetical protein CEXT_244761 [Caerostris extrusa]|uniref:Uncharacterized protein n=1 Tax=Caerostris extrusa TaxID=172846 RepID=A0AAV4QJQ9_CAEEX|nr:hypothetical protein CEXT_244761 [Caerostris extrusa]